MNIESIENQKAIETHIDTVMNYKPIYSTEMYSVYENGLVGKKLIGLNTADVIINLVSKINSSKEYFNKILDQKDMCILSPDDVYHLECEYCSVDFCPKYIAREALKLLDGETDCPVAKEDNMF